MINNKARATKMVKERKLMKDSKCLSFIEIQGAIPEDGSTPEVSGKIWEVDKEKIQSFGTFLETAENFVFVTKLETSQEDWEEFIEEYN